MNSNRLIFTCLLLLALLPSLVQAELLSNDGWGSGGALGFQSGFVVGEIGAVRLVPTTAGTWPLQNVQLMFGGATTSQEVILYIWDDTAGTNSPGSELYSRSYILQGSDNTINEIDLSGAGIMVSGPIRVGIEFTHSGTPSIARDTDGTIDAARNFIATGGAWYQSNLLGLTGDWVIRANTNTTATTTHTIGGTVTGLTGSMVLQNNAGDDLVINANGSFVFTTPLSDGSTYAVTVLSAPAGQNCQVTNGSGTVTGTDITNIQVTCTDGTSETTTLANDSFVDGGTAGFQSGFVAGEIAASRLTTPNTDPWALESVEFLFGGLVAQQTVTLKVWQDNGGTAAPGTEIFSGDYLVTGGDAMQQIDLSASALNVSGDFRIGLLFQHSGLPSVARDDNGIMPDRNFIYISTGAWLESSSLGLTGDWIIRATVSQSQVTEPFAITSIVDFPNDQGRQVRLTWPNNANDAAGSTTPVTGYAIFRRIDPNLKAYPPGDWDYLRTVPAFQEVSYATIVATAADSTIVSGMYASTFFVRAMTASAGVFFDTAPDSGYSVDNLEPQTPQSLTVAYNGVTGNALAWGDSPATDFDYFRIYRGDTPDFTADHANPAHTTTGTNWVDTAGGFDVYYRVSAVDFAGNESALTTSEATGVSGVGESGLPQVTILHSVFPNPFNPSTTIRFATPAAGQVRIAIYDTGGRLVRTLLNGHLSSGEHEAHWDGRDDHGRGLSSGVFFMRLENQGFQATRRMTLVK